MPAVASSPDPQAMAQPPVGRIVGGTDAGQNEIPYQVREWGVVGDGGRVCCG